MGTDAIPTTPEAAARRRRLTAMLVAFGLSNLIGVNALVLVLGAPLRQTPLYSAQAFFRGEQLADSWRPLRKSFEYVSSAPEHARTLYQKMFFRASGKHKGLQYPPTSLLLPYGLRAVLGAGWSPALEGITWLCIPLTLGCVLALWRRGLSGAPAAQPWQAGVEALMLGVMTLTFHPVMTPYLGGQIQTWINCAFAAALLCWVLDKQLLAGLLVGLVALVKPQLGLLLVWGLLRRRLSFVAGGALVLALGIGASLLALGLTPHLEYLDVLRFLSERGESFFPNQSVNGLLHRSLFNGENLRWVPPGARDTWMSHFPPYDARVYWGTLISSALLLAWALFGGLRSRGAGQAADFGRMALVATMASPIAWEHHYGVLLPIFALLAPTLWREQAPRRVWLVLLLAYLLSSNMLRPTNAFAPTHWNFIQSYLLGAALVVLGLLERARRRLAHEVTRAA